MKIKRHVFTRGADEGQALRNGFDLARSLALQHKTGVAFFCERKRGFQTLVGAMIGQDVAKELFRNYTATGADGTPFELMIPANFNDNAAGVMVALYPGRPWMERIDAMRDVSGIVFFAFQNKEAAEWAERWKAKKHGDLA